MIRPDVVDVDCQRGFRHETWAVDGCRGDRVFAEAWLSDDPGPIVIAGHGAASDRNAPYIRGAAKAWARRGISVVAADAPLHGDRAAGRPPPDPHDIHRVAFVEQAAADVIRVADAVVATLGDERPLGYLGFSMGTQYGVPAVADDVRIRAAVFCIGGSTSLAMPSLLGGADAAVVEVVAAIDPVRRAADIAGRPVLMVNADGDEVFSRESALALYDAFERPKEITFFPGRHVEWASPAQWYRRMEGFLREHLG